MSSRAISGPRPDELPAPIPGAGWCPRSWGCWASLNRLGILDANHHTREEWVGAVLDVEAADETRAQGFERGCLEPEWRDAIKTIIRLSEKRRDAHEAVRDVLIDAWVPGEGCRYVRSDELYHAVAKDFSAGERSRWNANGAEPFMIARLEKCGVDVPQWRPEAYPGAPVLFFVPTWTLPLLRCLLLYQRQRDAPLYHREATPGSATWGTPRWPPLRPRQKTVPAGATERAIRHANHDLEYRAKLLTLSRLVENPLDVLDAVPPAHCIACAQR